MAVFRQGYFRQLLVQFIQPSQKGCVCRRHYAQRMVEVGVMKESKDPSVSYETGQVFLHKVFGYRGIVMFPWKTKLFDMDSALTLNERNDVTGQNSSFKEVQGKECNYYLVMIDHRDRPYIKGLAKNEMLFIYKSDIRLRDNIADLDFASHEDLIPYSSTEAKPIEHYMFDKFFHMSSVEADQVAYGKPELQRFANKLLPSLQLSQIRRETTRNIQISVMSVYIGGSPLKDSFSWCYCIRIENLGKEWVQLRSRMWSIFSRSGELETVAGRGIVGKEPVLSQESPVFQYRSHVTLKTPSGHMWGKYEMELPDKSTFTCKIPLFFLESNEEQIKNNPFDLKR